MNSTWLAGGIFLITYGLIVTERVHRTLAALLGGLAMILLGVVVQEQAFHSVDWNVIFLLAGMMAIANVLRETGLFQWSRRCYRWCFPHFTCGFGICKGAGG